MVAYASDLYLGVTGLPGNGTNSDNQFENQRTND